MKGPPSSATTGTAYSRPLFTWKTKTKRGRPSRIAKLIKERGLDPYGGLLQPFLLEDQPLSPKEKKPAGYPPVLDVPDLLRLMSHVAGSEDRRVSGALGRAARSGLYKDRRTGESLTYEQLHNAYYNALRDAKFREAMVKAFGTRLLGRTRASRGRKSSRTI